MKNLILVALLVFSSVSVATATCPRNSNSFNRGFRQGFNEAQRQQRRGDNGVTVITRGARVFIR